MNKEKKERRQLRVVQLDEVTDVDLFLFVLRNCA